MVVHMQTLSCHMDVVVVLAGVVPGCSTSDLQAMCRYLLQAGGAAKQTIHYQLLL